MAGEVDDVEYEDLSSGWWEVIAYSEFEEVNDVTAFREGYVAVGWTGDDAEV